MPVGVFVAVAMVRVEEPLPDTLAGLKDAVAAVGKPVTLKVDVPVKPLSADMVAVYVVLEPITTDCVAGVAETVKSGVAIERAAAQKLTLPPAAALFCV